MWIGTPGRLLLLPRLCLDLKIIARCNLRYGHTGSCGCLGKNPDAYAYLIKDITGQRFVRLIALERAPSQKGGGAMWRCRYHCRKEIIASGPDIRSGNTQSWGAFAGLFRPQRGLTKGYWHGELGTLEGKLHH